MRKLGKQRTAGWLCWGRRIPTLALALLVFTGELGAAELQHRFGVLSSRVQVKLSSRATVTGCRADGNGFVISVVGVRASVLRQAFRNWRPDPLLSSVRVHDDSTGTQTTLVLSLGPEVPGAEVRAVVRKGVLEIVARLTRPATSQYYTAAGVYLARQGKHREALAQLRKAIALQPTNALAYLEAARVRASLGQRALAIFNARKALRDGRYRDQALSLLARLDPARWGQRALAAADARENGENVAEKAQVPVGAEAAVRNAGAPLSNVEVGPTEAAPTKPASGKGKPADKTPKGSTPQAKVGSPGPSTSVLAETQTKDNLENVDPLSIPGNAWAFVVALFVAALFTAPLTWVLVRAARKSPATSPKSPFVRVPASVAPLDDFQRLLAERAGNMQVAGLEEPEQEAEETASAEAVTDVQEEAEQLPVETRDEGKPTLNIPVGGFAERPFRDVRVELESVIALADRGISADEIARRVGMGKEEVRLILAMSRARPKPVTWAPAGEPGLTLTFAD